ncbi:MAG: hypothetical protein ABJZ69_03845, partial [Hyphomicrobiales bacterium]
TVKFYNSIEKNRHSTLPRPRRENAEETCVGDLLKRRVQAKRRAAITAASNTETPTRKQRVAYARQHLVEACRGAS